MVRAWRVDSSRPKSFPRMANAKRNVLTKKRIRPKTPVPVPPSQLVRSQTSKKKKLQRHMDRRAHLFSLAEYILMDSGFLRRVARVTGVPRRMREVREGKSNPEIFGVKKTGLEPRVMEW